MGNYYKHKYDCTPHRCPHFLKLRSTAFCRLCDEVFGSVALDSDDGTYALLIKLWRQRKYKEAKLEGALHRLKRERL